MAKVSLHLVLAERFTHEKRLEGYHMVEFILQMFTSQQVTPVAAVPATIVALENLRRTF